MVFGAITELLSTLSHESEGLIDKEAPLLPICETAKFWEALSPICREKTMAVGLTAILALIVRVTVIVTGSVLLPGSVGNTLMVPEYIPGVSPAAAGDSVAETETDCGAVPEIEVWPFPNCSQFRSLVAPAPNPRREPSEVPIVSVCVGGFAPPANAVKESVGGLTLSEGGTVTIKVTETVCGMHGEAEQLTRIEPL